MDQEDSFQTTQLWKLNEAAAKKEGVRRSIYEIKCKRKSNEDEDDLDLSIPQEWEIGKTYTGEWHNDLRDGYGVQIWSNQCKYEGEWKHDQRNGYGVYWIPLNQSQSRININTNNYNNHNQDDVTTIYTKTATELSSYVSKNVHNLLKVRDELFIQNKNNKTKIKTILTQQQR